MSRRVLIVTALLLAACTREPRSVPDYSSWDVIPCGPLVEKVAALGGLPYQPDVPAPRHDAGPLDAEALAHARLQLLGMCNGHSNLLPIEARECVMRAKKREDLEPCKQLTRRVGE